MKRRNTRGFSLIEMAMVLAIAMIMMSITFISLQPALRDIHNNQAYDLVMMQLRNARARAISDREQYIVCFGATLCTGGAQPMGAPTAQSIQIYEWPAGTALTSAVQVSNVSLPQDIDFQVLTGVPTGATPDGFGNASAALDFDQGVAGGITTQVMFMPDGSAHDTNGNLNSGVLYIGRTGDLYSSRAVTLFASSGRLRGWRLVNNSGVATWIQQ
jgi:prepilin-type N-terminal cleavage/methylation domain-containing protein